MNNKEPVADIDNDKQVFVRPYSGKKEDAAEHSAIDALNDAIVEAIVLSMRDGDGRTRCYGARALGEMKIKEAVVPLIRYLGDHDPDVRCDAATALGRIKDRRAVEPLIKSLEDEEGHVVICAIEALASIGDSNCIDRMISTMFFIRNFDYSLGADHSGNLLWEIKEKAAMALGEIGDRTAVSALIDILRDEDAEFMLGTVLKSLAQIGDGAGLATVSSYLKVPDAALRRKAAKALICTDDPCALTYLATALLDSDPAVRCNAMEAIGRLGGKGDIVPLVLLLNDKDPDVIVKAAEVIGRICGAEALAYIRPLLDNPDINVRRKAVEVLGSYCPADSFDQIAGVLRDRGEDEAVREEAVTALTKRGGQETVGVLLEVLNDKGIGTALRKKALVGLGKVRTEEGLHGVIRVLRDREEDKGIRQISFEVMRQFDKKIIPNCSSDLAGGDDLMKTGFAKMFRDLNDPVSEEMLFALLKDESDAVKKEAALSLAYRGSEAGLDQLISAAKSGKVDPFEFLDAAKNIKNEKAQNLFVDFLKSEDGSFRCGAAKAVGRSGMTEYARSLIGLLDDGEINVRMEAVIALGRIRDKSALEPLVDSLFDFERFYNFRRYIVMSIKRIDAAGAREMFLDILCDNEKKDFHWVVLEALPLIYGAA